MSAKNVIFFVDGYPYTGELAKRVREMSSQLCITLYTLSIYHSVQKQLSRHLLNPFREFPLVYYLKSFVYV